MSKILRISILMILMAGVALAAPSNQYNPPPFPEPLDNGGPDPYGYRWVDNDGGGGPTYQWVDITGVGTQVVGLADDNNVGPFSIGFEFPYYWYTVNRMWIGSNGYISFSSNANFAHPFASIPAASNPNDLVAVMAGDLDFTRPGASCYYYTNGVDSFVVSWIAVPQFSADHSLDDSTHTLQLILTKSDSTLTFQYAENHGNFGEGGNLADVIGIENVNGQVGLEYLEDNLPGNHMWHSGLAIKYHPIPDPNYVVHDFGVLGGLNETSGGVFHHVSTPFTPRGLFKNFGNVAEDTLPVRCIIRLNTTQVYSQWDTILNLAPAEQIWWEFPSQFTPPLDTVYRVSFSTSMSGDQNSTNNTITLELESYQLPQELKYCDNTPGATPRSWNGDFSGFGVEFQMPEGIRVSSAGFHCAAVTTPGPAYMWIMPDSAGHPQESNILWGDTINITSGQADTWVNSTVSPQLLFAADQTFYLVVLHAFQTTFAFNMDDTAPLSNRGWEYTGGLAPDRDRGTSDIMFKVMADTATVTGVHDDDVLPKTFSLAQNYPNPFNASTSINFSLANASDVRIDIFNIVGQLVEVISGHYAAGSNSVIWDASDVTSGVYFYKMSVGDVAETRRMVLVK
jgi:hypothetical protein